MGNFTIQNLGGGAKGVGLEILDFEREIGTEAAAIHYCCYCLHFSPILAIPLSIGKAHNKSNLS